MMTTTERRDFIHNCMTDEDITFSMKTNDRKSESNRVFYDDCVAEMLWRDREGKHYTWEMKKRDILAHHEKILRSVRELGGDVRSIGYVKPDHYWWEDEAAPPIMEDLLTIRIVVRSARVFDDEEQKNAYGDEVLRRVTRVVETVSRNEGCVVVVSVPRNEGELAS